MRKTAEQIIAEATPAQRRQVVMALRAAVSAQVLLWKQQLTLERALQGLLKVPELHDEQDAAAGGLVVDMAAAWNGQIIQREDLETLVDRVLKATGV